MSTDKVSLGSKEPVFHSLKWLQSWTLGAVVSFYCLFHVRSFLAQLLEIGSIAI